jgi:hypothetical protein
MEKIKEIIKKHIMEDVFQNGYPSMVMGQNSFDFILTYEINDMVLPIPNIEELDKLGFEVSCIHEFDSLIDIQGLLESKYNNQLKLQDEIYSSCTKWLQINKTEFVNVDDFEYYKIQPNGVCNRDDTEDEYVTFKTINLGDLL